MTRGMLRAVKDNHKYFVEHLTAKQLISVAIIDPGTNSAIRFCVYRYSPQSGITCEVVMQTFIAGTASGDNYTERMSMLSRSLMEHSLFRCADLYVIESQFENNVTITLGVLIGIISTIRSADVSTRTKRTGTITVDKIPYDIMTMCPSMKSAVIVDTLHAKPNSKNIKDLGIHAAIQICQKYNDGATLEMLNDSTKKDDIADTVCYGEALLNFIRNGK